MQSIKEKVREHYDVVSPYYQKLWGDHIHHGYWRTGKESKEEAAENLIKLLVEHAQIPNGAKVLDVGCGVGGTSIWLSEHKSCDVTGVTISPIQVEMAKAAATRLAASKRPRFMVDDANDLSVKGPFDVVWAVEMISHLERRDNLFKKISILLKKGGRMCITDWMKDEDLSRTELQRYIKPIEEGMIVDLPDLAEYKRHFYENGLRMIYYEDINPYVAKTWDISLGLIKKPALWSLAKNHGKEFVAFLKAFKAMKEGFKSGAFRYAAMVVEKR